LIAPLAALAPPGSRFVAADFVVARRRKACRLVPPQHSGARSEALSSTSPRRSLTGAELPWQAEHMSQYWNEVPEESEQLDQLEEQRSLVDRGVEDPLDEGYSPPERYSQLIREGEHETLDERLEDEIPEPDPYAPREEEVLDDGEVGEERAGRLVEPNEGIGPDVESDLVGTDVGIDGGAASAEEAAVHIVPDDEQAS
jgi:hypothetical protein